jgi:hypothetical protein
MATIQVPFLCWSRTTIGGLFSISLGAYLTKVRNFRLGRGSVREEDERFVLDLSSQLER